MPDRFDIDNRRTVEGFQRPDFETVLRLDLKNRDPVQTDGIWPVGRTGCEHSDWVRKNFIARMDLQAVAVSQMEPGQYDDLGPHRNSVKRFYILRIKEQPCVGCAFVSLPRRVFATMKLRSNRANGIQ